jgi:hypothetical protein
MQALVDDAPSRSRVSGVEAFLLWMAHTVLSPDDFQHACVFLKYALRGAALQHCAARILPVNADRW